MRTVRSTVNQLPLLYLGLHTLCVMCLLRSDSACSETLLAMPSPRMA